MKLEDLTPVSWTSVEPDRVELEKQAMIEHAPEMVWRDDLVWRGGRRAVGWRGPVPTWAADRPAPEGLGELLNGARLEVKVFYPEAFPAAPPVLMPIRPEIPFMRYTDHAWHLNGDGSICLLREAGHWNPLATAADLVRKAAGWFVEYKLFEAKKIDAMSENGIFVDTLLDEVIAACK